jgi:hypothetical protein
MSSGVERLAKVAWMEEGQDAHEFTGSYVTSVNADGTVALSYLGEVHPYVEALASYTDRQIGDLVIVRSNGDHWTVIGKVGPEWTVEIPPFPTVPPVHQHPYTDIQSPPPTVTWGLTDPSPMTGWNVIITGAIWGHNDGRIYCKAGTGTPPPPPPPPDPPYEPPPTPPPAVTTILVASQHAYNFVSPDMLKTTSSKYPQGYNDGSYAGVAARVWGTLFLYSNLKSFIDTNWAKINKVEVRCIRSSETHGTSGGEVPRIWFSDLTSASSPMSDTSFTGIDFYTPYTGPSLARGAEGWWTMPTAALNLIHTGTARSLFFYSPNAADFMLFASGTGQVKVTLNP